MHRYRQQLCRRQGRRLSMEEACRSGRGLRKRGSSASGPASREQVSGCPAVWADETYLRWPPQPCCLSELVPEFDRVHAGRPACPPFLTGGA